MNWEPAAEGNTFPYEALGEGITLTSAPLEHETEITGPVKAKLFMSSSTADLGRGAGRLSPGDDSPG